MVEVAIADLLFAPVPRLSRLIAGASSHQAEFARTGVADAVRIDSVGRGRWYLAALGLAAALLAAVPAAAIGSKYFRSGRTAGEITDHSAIVWARTSRELDVRAQVATNSSFRHVVARPKLEAREDTNRTVQTEIDGLKPDHTYSYRFCAVRKHTCSGKAQFETAPAPNDPKTIRFAYTGDETGVSRPGETEPFWGHFRTFKSITAEDNDFNIDFGDTIYSDPEVPGWGSRTALSVDEKWAMYRKKLHLRNMRRVRASTGMYNHWDDHEFRNDFSIPEDGQEIYDNGVAAFRDFMPVHYTKQTGLYRTVRWGKNLELFFLDERSFRSAKASANGVCDNPETPGQPDLAPTAPEDKRQLFSALIPSLDQPVSQQCKNAINDPQRTMLGKAQLQRFLDDVESSDAQWKVVMNETPIQQFYGLPYDRWEGYAYERVQLLKALEDANVDNLVFLTTDTHAAFANIVRLRTLDGDVAPSNAPAATPSDTPYNDFIIGPVATKPFWEEIDDTTGSPGSGELLSNVFFKPPPQGGVGMACAQGGQPSYAEVTVKSGSLSVAYKKANGSTVTDVDGTTPCGPYVLTP
jgi:phosphodiesterase/alkaline phosphatase D-like protein